MKTPKALSTQMAAFARQAQAQTLALADRSVQATLDQAQARVPVKTGRLKASLTQTDLGPDQRRFTWTAPYAAAVEYGTPARPPAHFMTFALHQWPDTVQDAAKHTDQQTDQQTDQETDPHDV